MYNHITIITFITNVNYMIKGVIPSIKYYLNLTLNGPYIKFIKNMYLMLAISYASVDVLVL